MFSFAKIGYFFIIAKAQSKVLDERADYSEKIL